MIRGDCAPGACQGSTITTLTSCCWSAATLTSIDSRRTMVYAQQGWNYQGPARRGHLLCRNCGGEAPPAHLKGCFRCGRDRLCVPCIYGVGFLGAQRKHWCVGTATEPIRTLGAALARGEATWNGKWVVAWTELYGPDDSPGFSVALPQDWWHDDSERDAEPRFIHNPASYLVTVPPEPSASSPYMLE